MEYFALNKKNFLDSKNLSESIVKGYGMIFNKIEGLEKGYNKDLKDFNREQLLECLELIRSKSYNALNTKWSLIKIYLDFYSNEDVKSITQEDLKANINKSENAERFISRGVLYQKVEELINPSDKAILLLLFEGVMGSAYKELLELKVDQVDIDNGLVKLKDRTIIVSDYTKGVLKDTINTSMYFKNGNEPNILPYQADYDLNMNSPYLLKTKPTVKTNNGLNPLKVEGLKSKLRRLLEYLGLEQVTGLSLYHSGLIERILKEEKNLGKEMSLSQISDFAKSLGVKRLQAQVLKESMEVYKSKYNIK